MTRLRLVGLCLMASAGFILAHGAPQSKGGPKKKVEISNTETIPFVSRGEIYIKDSFGEVRVEGWDRPEVVMTITKALETDDTPADRAKKLEKLETIKVSATREPPDRLVISSTVGFRRNLELVYEIKVPRETDLRIKHDIGEVSSKNVVGDIEITGRIGEISVELPEGEYAIDAGTRIGDVSSDFPVKGRRPYLVGATARSTGQREARTVFLRVGIGQIDIRKAPRPKTGLS